MSFHDWEKTAFLDPSHIKFMFKITKFKKTFFLLFSSIFLFLFRKDKNKKCKKSRKSSKSREKRVEPLSSLYSAVPEIQISRNASWYRIRIIYY